LWRGTYELPVQAALVRLLGPGKVLYDVGGGIGFYSLLAARWGAKALVFEPDAYNAGCIRRHAEVNGGISKVEVVKSAVYSHTGWVALKPADQSRGHGNAHVLAGQPAGSLAKVPCTRLDDFVGGRPAPNVVKVDVEGAESEVLKGAEKVFAGPRPHLICEVHDASNAQFVEQWLNKMGYELQWLEPPETFPVQLLGSPCEVNS
jgi:FkbM family methyltransferase